MPTAKELYDAFMAGWQAAQSEEIQEVKDLDDTAEEAFLKWLAKAYPPQAY